MSQHDLNKLCFIYESVRFELIKAFAFALPFEPSTSYTCIQVNTYEVHFDSFGNKVNLYNYIYFLAINNTLKSMSAQFI